MPATSSTVPPAVKMLRLKVAADSGLPALFRTSRPGQANFRPGVGVQEVFSGPNEVRVNSATTIRYGAKAISASRPVTGPVVGRRSRRGAAAARGRPRRRARWYRPNRCCRRRRRHRPRGGRRVRAVSRRRCRRCRDLGGLPDPQQQHQGQGPGERRDDVGDLVVEEVRAEELRDAEGEPRRRRPASQVCRTPRRPSTISTRISGTKTARIGVCRPTMAPRQVRVEAGDLAQGGDRHRDGAERDRGGVGDQGDRRGLDRA